VLRETDLASVAPTVARFTEYLRGLLRTRKRAQFAPVFRNGLLLLIALCFVFPIIALCLLQMEDPSTPRLASACGFSAILNMGIAGIYMLSDPKASSMVSTGVYVVSLGVILIVTGYLVRSTLTHNPNRANLDH
jgi:4-amino-4-deoxy-L-arabinose transferase-like glycosyltransferase